MALVRVLVIGDEAIFENKWPSRDGSNVASMKLAKKWPVLWTTEKEIKIKVRRPTFTKSSLAILCGTGSH
jgi:hypothetical protein